MPNTVPYKSTNVTESSRCPASPHLAAGVVEQEAAGAVGVLSLSLLQTRLSHQRRLLVAQNLRRGGGNISRRRGARPAGGTEIGSAEEVNYPVGTVTELYSGNGGICSGKDCYSTLLHTMLHTMRDIRQV